jgi:zinc and cadmium transporter
MPIMVWVLVFSLLGSLGVVVAAALLLSGESRRRHLLPSLISYAAGTLLAAAFLGMLPRALEGGHSRAVLWTTLFGLILFFILEKWVLWRHCHEAECDIHSAAGPLILAGDAFHNFVDGFAIASAFLISVPLGVSTSLAVIAHEIPQEVGDFAILLESGYARDRALIYNLLSSATTMPGALLAYFALSASMEIVPYVLALSAASFIYIAVADLIPGLHRHSPRSGLHQLLLMLSGIATVVLVPWLVALGRLA